VLALAFSLLLLLAGAISVHSYFRLTMAVEALSDIVLVAASAQEIHQATRDIDHLTLLCVMDESRRPPAELDARWSRVDEALRTLQRLVVSRRGQTALVSIERLTVTLRERVGRVLSRANQGERVGFTVELDGIAQTARYIADDCNTLLDDDLGYFSQVQALIRSRTRQTAFIIIIAVAAVLVLSLIGQAVVFSQRIREIGRNQAERERLLDALSAKGRDLERQVEERTRAEMALRRSEAHTASLFDSIRDAVVATDQRGHITRVNPVAREWLGEAVGTGAEVDVGNALRMRGHDQPAGELVRGVLDTGTPYVSTRPLGLARPGQPDLPVSASISPIRSQAGDLAGCVIVLRDVSAALAIQERTQHAAKMEAIGQLAGGVAHDFNNLLTGIIGNAELLQADLKPGSAEADMAIQIQQIGARAAQLVRRLMGFARRGQLQMATIDLHALIDEVVALLQHSVDKRIRLVRNLAATNPWIHGDPSQLQNALLNLGLNARDAMPDGGELVLTTHNEPYDEGDGITIEVRDTGCGIPDELLDRIFEPFFTTKEQGKGTGLGLASVYGCVQSHQGDIQVESTPGRGSVFRIRLPVAHKQDVAASAANEQNDRLPHKGLALVVDDEEMVRSVATSHLIRLGFEVFTTGNVSQALAWVAERPGSIDLVLLDMTMPTMNGAEVFRAIRAVDPGAPILLVSGYTTIPDVPLLLQTGSARFLAKPFRLEDLAKEVMLLVGQAQARSMRRLEQVSEA
jgi:PAS domain S-box-containing protein